MWLGLAFHMSKRFWADLAPVAKFSARQVIPAALHRSPSLEPLRPVCEKVPVEFIHSEWVRATAAKPELGDNAPRFLEARYWLSKQLNCWVKDPPQVGADGAGVGAGAGVAAAVLVVILEEALFGEEVAGAAGVLGAAA